MLLQEYKKFAEFFFFYLLKKYLKKIKSQSLVSKGQNRKMPKKHDQLCVPLASFSLSDGLGEVVFSKNEELGVLKVQSYDCYAENMMITLDFAEEAQNKYSNIILGHLVRLKINKLPEKQNLVTHGMTCPDLRQLCTLDLHRSIHLP